MWCPFYTQGQNAPFSFWQSKVFEIYPKNSKAAPANFPPIPFIYSPGRLSHPESAECLCHSPLCITRYGEAMADFTFDYLTKELHFISSEGKALTEKIIAVFRMFYSSRRIRVSYDELEYEDEDTTYEYDETDEYAPSVKHLNK